jgi:hypothetical protein
MLSFPKHLSINLNFTNILIKQMLKLSEDEKLDKKTERIKGSLKNAIGLMDYIKKVNKINYHS